MLDKYQDNTKHLNLLNGFYTLQNGAVTLNLNMCAPSFFIKKYHIPKFLDVI